MTVIEKKDLLKGKQFKDVKVIYKYFNFYDN